MKPVNRATAELDELGIEYEVRRHGRVGSLVEAAAARGVEASHLVKTMVVRVAEGNYRLVMVPGDSVISWPKLRELLGVSRMTMAGADEAREVTGYERGTITPFGAPKALEVIVDERVVGETISVGGGEHGMGITISADDLIKAKSATVAAVTEPAY
ncbi:MAG: hypothetical protein GEU79_09650 [Acidimicrobiia bacterium]|nr:hypothetical protein [Acidimicrobiia bacterium]